MKILGIDPGLTVTGYGLIELTGNKITPLDWGVIRSGSGTLAERLWKLHSKLTEIINQHKPDLISVEEIFVARDPRAALKMGHARGIALLAAANSPAIIAEYPANTIKQAVAGRGHAAKDQVRYMVGRLLGMSMEGIIEDASDALAVAICAALKLNKSNITSGRSP